MHPLKIFQQIWSNLNKIDQNICEFLKKRKEELQRLILPRIPIPESVVLQGETRSQNSRLKWSKRRYVRIKVRIGGGMFGAEGKRGAKTGRREGCEVGGSKGVLFRVSIPSNQRRCVIDAKIVALNTGSSFLRPADASRIALCFYLVAVLVRAHTASLWSHVAAYNVVTSCPSLFIGRFDHAY